VGVGNHQVDPLQAATHQLAQEFQPEGVGLRRADVHAEHLAPAVGVHPDRDDDRLREDAPILAHLHVGGIDPEVAMRTLERPLEERLHPLVDPGCLSPKAAAVSAATSELHQPLGGETDHLPRQIRIGGLLHQAPQVHHLLGHRGLSGSGLCEQPQPYWIRPTTTRAAVRQRQRRVNARWRAAALLVSYTTTWDTIRADRA
jgi:hypothetical protein